MNIHLYLHGGGLLTVGPVRQNVADGSSVQLVLRHLDEHDSCDSLYDSLVTAYLEQRVYCEPERAEAAESLAVDVHVRDEAPAEGEEPGPDVRI